jgi:hypothetical protein
MYWGLSSATGSQKFLLTPYARLIGGIRAEFGLESNPAVLIPLLDVRYLIGRAEQSPEVFDLLAETDGRRLYRIRTGVAHAYFAARVETVRDTLEAVRRTRENFDPLTLAIVETSDGSPTGPAAATPPRAGAGSAVIERYEPDLVELAVRAESAGLLVVSEIYHPNWHAWVDGEEVPIWRTNVAFRGVEVPAGEHRVRFAYRSASFVAGRAISIAATLVLVIGLGALSLRSRRRAP